MASGEINQRRVMWTAEHVTQAGLDSSNAKKFPKGTVMLAMNGQGATRGKVALLGIEAACNQSLAAITGNGTDNPFLFQLLQSSYDHLRALTGDGRSGLNLGLIRSLPILLPTIPEQRAIAVVLNSIDEAIERTDTVIAATGQLRDSLLHQLLTRGVPGWHTEWKEAPGIGTIPADWKMVRLGELLDGGPSNGIYKPESEYGSGTWLIRIDDFVPGDLVATNEFQRIRASEEEIVRYAVRRGDILINRVNSLSHIGKSVMIPALEEPALFESNMMKLSIGPKIQAEFAAIVLLSNASKTYFTSRAKKAVQQASINQQDVSLMPFPLPKLTEQRAIANLLNSIEGAVKQAYEQREGLQSLKASAADALLTGRVQVRV